MKLKEIASLVSGTISGDDKIEIKSLAPISEAGLGQLSFILDKTILTVSILACIYIISLFAAHLRNVTRNSWDAVLFYFLCYITYLHADEILIYLQSIIG